MEAPALVDGRLPIRAPDIGGFLPVPAGPLGPLLRLERDFSKRNDIVCQYAVPRIKQRGVPWR
jgi:hypothetical protein